MSSWSNRKPCNNCGETHGTMVKCNNCGTLGCHRCIGAITTSCKICKKRDKVKV